MTDSAVEQIRQANAKLRAVISETRNALAGCRTFSATDVRAIAEPVAALQPIVDGAEKLRLMHPELDAELETYKGNLEEIQVALEQMRVMLTVRRGQIAAARSHVATLGMWSATLRMTR
ncbi:MAG TPA: hypothetical protein VEJ38_08635 [Candidatus Acidoferrales bacterium]|nr:hypothetical protein [Candidatus Acidoferrales bacterium]